jgi:hypothetical protein
MSRRRNAQKNDRRNGILLVLLALVLGCGLLGGYWWVRKSKIPLDEANCPVAGPNAVHVIIFDQSDPISGQQSQQIRQRIQALKATAAFGLRFDIYTLDGDAKNALNPVLRVCSPGKPEEANELIENPELIRRKYEEKFSSVLDRTIDQLLVPSVRKSSPIIESMKAAGITSFGPLDSTKTPLYLTLISDMIQHSDAYSNFRTDPSFVELSRNSTWPLVRPNLKGALVDVLYLLRPEARRQGKVIQNRGHELFWEQLIKASNGVPETFVPI